MNVKLLAKVCLYTGNILHFNLSSSFPSFSLEILLHSGEPFPTLCMSHVGIKHSESSDFPVLFFKQIVADTNIASYATEPMHAPITQNQSHNYMNLEEIEGINNSLPIGLKGSVESLSSTSTDSNLDNLEEEMLKHARTESKDSFYESDKDELSFVSLHKDSPVTDTRGEKPPVKQKPNIKPKPVPLPRKQESVTSFGYENDEAIELLKEHENAIKASQGQLEAMPFKTELDLTFDYENTLEKNTKQSAMADDQRSDSPEVFEYENSSLGPLPSYEEAVSDEAEFFNMDDLEAPPVPARDDSKLVTTPKQGHISSEEVLSYIILNSVCV